ncbi:hypothetical protein LguiA_029701 [Lonicera macranthoides]
MKKGVIDITTLDNQHLRDSFRGWGLHAIDNHQGAAKPSSQVQKPLAADDEDMDAAQYFENRLKTLAAQNEARKNPYPHKFHASISILDYVEKFGDLNSGEQLEDAEVSLAGRITNKRSSSSKLFFYDLQGGGAKVQVMADARRSDLDEAEFVKFHCGVKRGDIVGITGFPGRSIRGELSIFPKSFVVLSDCLHTMPQQKTALGSDNVNVNKTEEWVPGSGRNPEDQETQYRQRYLDWTLNTEIQHIFKTRAMVISHIRRFLNDLEFLEVETPLINMIAGGGVTHPFVTNHNDPNMKQFMRKPELYLKELVGGGLDRVYKIGKPFKNERIDLTHNPEFTTCEFYMAFADCNDLMGVTEKMLSGMIKELTGGHKVKYHANGLDSEPIEIDFTPPFRRIDMIKDLERMANLSIPKDLAGEEARKYLADACTKFNIQCPPPQTTTHLLEKLVGHFLEETCINPTFIINHPGITSPLAKWHRSKPGLTERFELFINKHELCNAYMELNDHVVQCQYFADQLKDQHLGDDEAMALDETICMALKYGLPPTGGWLLNIDELAMMLTDSQNIKNHFASDDKGNYEGLNEAMQKSTKARQRSYEAAMKQNIGSKKVNDEHVVVDMPEGLDHSNKKEQANDGLFRLCEIGLANTVSLMGSNPPLWATTPASQRLLGFSGAANAVGYLGTTAAVSLRYTKPGAARIFANVGPIGCAWGVIMGFTSYLPVEFQWLGYVAAMFCTLAVLSANY